MTSKIFIITLFLFAFLSSSGQSTWSNMSANQKIKLAKKEQKAAKKDKEYLRLMEEALQFFQAKDYENAKAKYEAAHLRRPDNVYPMVMLDDIKIAEELQKEEALVVEELIPEEEIETTSEINIEEEKEVVAPPIAEEKSEPESEVKSEEIILPKDPEIEITKTQKPDLHPERKVVITQEPKVYEEDGTFFKTFKEGSATVEQIDIVLKGVKTSYRKVSHSWGAVYYFKNEDSITKEEWQKVFDKAKED